MLSTRFARSPRGECRAPRRFLARLELLEDRTVPSTFTVLNLADLYHAFDPLNAMSDATGDTAAAEFDESSPTRYQEFLARHLMLEYARWDVESQARVLDALQYGLATGRVEFAAVLAYQWYSPMPCPGDPREVCEALCDLLVPGRSYHTDDIGTWQESNIREEAIIYLQTPELADAGRHATPRISTPTDDLSD
jgi:hypothetical protein